MNDEISFIIITTKEALCPSSNSSQSDIFSLNPLQQLLVPNLRPGERPQGLM